MQSLKWRWDFVRLRKKGQPFTKPEKYFLLHRFIKCTRLVELDWAVRHIWHHWNILGLCKISIAVLFMVNKFPVWPKTMLHFPIQVLVHSQNNGKKLYYHQYGHSGRPVLLLMVERNMATATYQIHLRGDFPACETCIYWWGTYFFGP